MIVEAGESEGVFLAEFDMEKVRAYRKRETWGNAYRRLRLYGLLTSPEVEEPFKRADATRWTRADPRWEAARSQKKAHLPA